ncbi:MAG: histidine phosphatase family protein [Alphaproteobacteria bacterium]
MIDINKERCQFALVLLKWQEKDAMPIPHKTFYFIRHGETDFNKLGIIMGSIDEPLNERGFEQARSAASILESVKFDRIISSPRKRAMQTAECVAAKSPKPLLVEDNLAERVWGEAEGKPFDTSKSLFDEEYTPTGAEPFSIFKIRILMAIRSHLEKAPNQTLLFVSHGGVFYALCHELGAHKITSSNAIPYLFRPPENPTHPWMICSLLDE